MRPTRVVAGRRARLLALSWFGAIGALFIPQFGTAEPAWFSDAPPSAEWAKRVRSSHGGAVERSRAGLYTKRLWYREGPTPESAVYSPDYGTLSYDLLVVDPTGEPVTPTSFQVAEGTGITFEMPEEGFYNAYLVTRRVDGEILEARVLKAEVLKHSCGEGHDRQFTESRMPFHVAHQVPIEIVRERLEGEDFHTRLASGDTLNFQVLHQGKPAAGATVAMTSGTGWTRSVTADTDGRASFQQIRDYYPDWNLFNKRKSQSFLVTAHVDVAEAGTHEGKRYSAVRYSATYPGTYYPPPRDYQSYLYGLIVMLAALALTAGGIFLYRLKSTKPSRERFDESA